MPHAPTILIVDDDPAIRKMLVEVLSLEGYPTETAVNGREALDLLARGGARVVLLDLLMPVLDGRGVMTELQANPAERGRHKVILVSAITNLEGARDLEPDSILPKPFTVEQLLNVLETASRRLWHECIMRGVMRTISGLRSAPPRCRGGDERQVEDAPRLIGVDDHRITDDWRFAGARTDRGLTTAINRPRVAPGAVRLIRRSSYPGAAYRGRAGSMRPRWPPSLSSGNYRSGASVLSWRVGSSGIERVAIDLFPPVPASAQGLPAELAVADRPPFLLGIRHPVFEQTRVGAEHVAQFL